MRLVMRIMMMLMMIIKMFDDHLIENIYLERLQAFPWWVGGDRGANYHLLQPFILISNHHPLPPLQEHK